MLPMTVTHATKADLPTVAATLARAFYNDPVQVWVFDALEDRLPALERFMAYFVDKYFHLGHIYVGNGNQGATMWAPPDRHALHEEDVPALISVVGADIGIEAAIAKLTELGRSADYLPDEPHFYLGIAGVDPAHQSTGLGAQLLVSCLQACDDGGFLAHLESSNPKNIPFYERHGFQVIDGFSCGSDDGPVMTIMTRAPQR
jgi:GNAT superfamily N-acetyltransferase